MPDRRPELSSITGWPPRKLTWHHGPWHGSANTRLSLNNNGDQLSAPRQADAASPQFIATDGG